MKRMKDAVREWRERRLKNTLRPAAGYVCDVLAAAGILAIVCGGAWSYCFASPCRIEADCRGRDIDVKQLRTWEEQEESSRNGFLDMAGWRIEPRQNVSSVSTGRRCISPVTAVYGNAALVYPAKILSGDYALPYTEDGTNRTEEGTVLRTARAACILTEELSRELFGSTDTAGELVKAGDELLVVAGVIDREGRCLMRQAADGPVEYAAFRMESRFQAKEKVLQRVGGE